MTALSQPVQDPGYALAFRLREPQPARPRALLVLLHGVGGNEANLAGLAGAAPADTLVVQPRGRLTLGQGQYAWFRVAFTAQGPSIVAEEAEASRLVLTQFVSQLQAAHGIAPDRTVIAGFSQGGILSASVALAAPERVRGFAVLAGRILPELEPMIASRERLSRLRGWIAHARQDSKLPLAWAERGEAWLDALGVAHDLRLYDGDHGLSAAMAADFAHWSQSLLEAGPPLAYLEIGPHESLVRDGDGGTQRLAPGLARLIADHFSGRPLALAMEGAIADTEDGLARVPRAWRGVTLASRDPRVLAVATAADADASLTREAVEQVFARQSAVASGHPPASVGLPDDPVFAAALVVLREIMHHLDIPAITLEAVPAGDATLPH
jgi:phospholipase/carboxylesterase